jgi:hypothetical protein
MTEQTKIRRNAVAVLRRAYSWDNERKLSEFRHMKYNCGMTTEQFAGFNVWKRICRAEEALASIGLRAVRDGDAIVTYSR